MKIATWNIERLKHRSKMPEMVEAILKEKAPIVILTEADTRLDLSMYAYRYETKPLEAPTYKPTERRVIIYSVFPCVGYLPTYDPQTAVCPILETNLGMMAVYGSIIGIYGNREASFIPHLEEQIKDWETIAQTYPLCIAGDFNMSFGDNYYFTKKGRTAMKTAFTKNNLVNMTGFMPETIDHVVLSRSIVDTLSEDNVEPVCHTWNDDKTMSDHVGITLYWLKFLF